MATKTLSIQVTPPLKGVWWGNQPFPPFDVRIVSDKGDLDTSTISGWKLALALIDQKGRWHPIDEHLVVDGRSRITSVRFPQNQSLFFRIAFVPSHPQLAGSLVNRYISEPIQLLPNQSPHSLPLPTALLPAPSRSAPVPSPTVFLHHSVEKGLRPSPLQPLPKETPQVCFAPTSSAGANPVVAVKPPQEKLRDETVELAGDEDQAVREMPLALRFANPLEALWYADRHFPRFEVEIVRTDTDEVVSSVNGWRVGLTIVDGNGAEATHAVHDHERLLAHPHVIRNGRVSVGGIRFSRVSSKCGGFFRVVVAVVKPGPFLMVVSDKIQILSYRLYHSPKVPADRLRGEDSVSKMKGIGSLYARRFAMLGTTTISQLAAISLDSMNEAERLTLLDALRKERGGLTLAKLQTLIHQAREIVLRDHGVECPEISSPLTPMTPPQDQFTSQRRSSLVSHCSNTPPSSPMPKQGPSPRPLKRALSNELGPSEEDDVGESRRVMPCAYSCWPQAAIY